MRGNWRRRRGRSNERSSTFQCRATPIGDPISPARLAGRTDSAGEGTGGTSCAHENRPALCRSFNNFDTAQRVDPLCEGGVSPRAAVEDVGDVIDRPELVVAFATEQDDGKVDVFGGFDRVVAGPAVNR